MRSERRLAKLESVLRHRQPDLTVVIEDIHDPHNVSAMFRSCDAAGVVEVQLLYTVEKFPRIGKKSSASAGKWIDRREFTSVEPCYSTLRKEGFKIYATHLSETAVNLYDVDLSKKSAIVFGNEHRGVSDEAANQADGIIQIPMFGMIQSLNVSVACAITLYEALRQRLAKGHYDKSKFSEKELKKMLDGWVRK
ncbi:MAG: RNA methyltransferase [Ignavibacteriales bacterium]|nr:RNA methyltransferase [Ignavibacteriales bacterium]